MEVSGQLHAPATLTPGNKLWYSLDWRVDKPLSQYRCGGEEKNLCPHWELKLGHPAHSLSLQ